MAYEGALWSWMQRHGKDMDSLDMRRVENIIDRGTPDVDLCWCGAQAWVELKGCERPKRPVTPIRLQRFTDFQRLWLKRRWRSGGLSWLYVRVGSHARTSRYLLCPGDAGLLERAQAGMTEAELAEASLLRPDHVFGEALRRICHRQDYPMTAVEAVPIP